MQFWYKLKPHCIFTYILKNVETHALVSCLLGSMIATECIFSYTLPSGSAEIQI